MSEISLENEPEADVPRFIHLIASGLLWVGGVASILIAIFGTADAVSSVLRGRPLAGVVEFTQLALVTLVFTVQPYVLVHRAHIRLDLIQFRPGSLSDLFSRTLAYLSALLCYGLVAWAAWPSLLSSLAAREHTEGIIALPVYPVKGLLFLGAAISFAIVLILTLRSIYLSTGGRRTSAEKGVSWIP